MRLKIKKLLFNNLIGLLLLISILLIFFVNLNIFKKSYIILKSNTFDRLIERYGYCNGEGFGFIKFIQNKYDLKQNPIIINYAIYPSPYWMLENTKIQFNNNQIILINYPNSYTLNFKKKNKNEFVNSNFVEHSSGIKNINLHLDNNKKTERISAKINIIKLFHNKEKLVKTFFIDQEYSNKISIPVDFDTSELNSRWEKIIVRIYNTNYNIRNINFDMKNLYNPNLTKIIEKYESCYYVNK